MFSSDKDGVVIHDSIGRQQKAVIINESGLYALILSSQLLATKRDFILTLMRQQLAAADPDADPNDIEVELAMQLTERHGQ